MKAALIFLVALLVFSVGLLLTGWHSDEDDY